MKRLAIHVLALLSLCGQAASAAPGNAPSPCEARSFDFTLKGSGWKHQPLSKLKRDTVYTVVEDAGHSVLRAGSKGSASLFVTGLQPAVQPPAALAWRWKTDALVPGADNRVKQLEDAPLRVIVAFDGDPASLPAAEQKRRNNAKRLFGREPPFAVLMYIWSDQVAVESVLASAHTSQVKMWVVASGKAGLGGWQSVRRNVAEDYRRAFGGEAGALTGIGVMTDTDNTGAKAVGYYADIRFECGR